MQNGVVSLNVAWLFGLVWHKLAKNPLKYVKIASRLIFGVNNYKMFEFAWPWVFGLMPLPWLAARLLPPASSGMVHAVRVPFFADLNSALALPKRPLPSRLSGVLSGLIWLLLLTATARPQWLGEPVALPVSGRDILLAVDVSGSMAQQDFIWQGQTITRLDAIKQIVSPFIQRREGDRLGLILFGTQAYLQTPLSFDRKTTATLLQEAAIGIAGKETAIGDAIGLALKRLQGIAQASRVLILLTDGENTAGSVSPEQATQWAVEQRVKIYTIGLGADSMRVASLFGTHTVNPSQGLDEKALQHIAKVTGGQYFRAKDLQGLQAIYQQLDQLEPIASDTQFFRPVADWFFWPLAVALLLSMGWAVYWILSVSR